MRQGDCLQRETMWVPAAAQVLVSQTPHPASLDMLESTDRASQTQSSPQWWLLVWAQGWRSCLALPGTHWARTCVFTRCFCSTAARSRAEEGLCTCDMGVCKNIPHGCQQWPSRRCARGGTSRAGRGAGARGQNPSVWGLKWGARPPRQSHLCALLHAGCVCDEMQVYTGNHCQNPAASLARHLGFAFTPPVGLSARLSTMSCSWPLTAGTIVKPEKKESLHFCARPPRVSRASRLSPGAERRGALAQRCWQAQISCGIMLPVHARREMCRSRSRLRARAWLFSRTPPKSRHLASRAAARQMPPRANGAAGWRRLWRHRKAADGPATAFRPHKNIQGCACQGETAPCPHGSEISWVAPMGKHGGWTMGNHGPWATMGGIAGSGVALPVSVQPGDISVTRRGDGGLGPCPQPPALPLWEQSLHISIMSSRFLPPRSLLYSSPSVGPLEHGPGARQQHSCPRGVCVTTRTNTVHSCLRSPLLQQLLMQRRSLGLAKQGKTVSMAQCLPHTISPGKWAGMVNPSLLFAQHISVLSLNRLLPWCTAAQGNLHCRINRYFFSKKKARTTTMPLTPNEGSCCHLKRFLFHQEISLSALPSSSGGVSIKSEPLAMFAKESGVGSHE